MCAGCFKEFDKSMITEVYDDTTKGHPKEYRCEKCLKSWHRRVE